MRPYGAVGYDGLEGSAKGAEHWAKQGFQGVRAKIGYPSIKEDMAVIRSMRKAVGDDIAIMVDLQPIAHARRGAPAPQSAGRGGFDVG